jgi:hypothetical protein
MDNVQNIYHYQDGTVLSYLPWIRRSHGADYENRLLISSTQKTEAATSSEKPINNYENKLRHIQGKIFNYPGVLLLILRKTHLSA